MSENSLVKLTTDYVGVIEQILLGFCLLLSHSGLGTGRGGVTEMTIELLILHVKKAALKQMKEITKLLNS